MPNLTGLLAGFSGLPAGFQAGEQAQQQMTLRDLAIQEARSRLAAQGPAFRAALGFGQGGGPAIPPPGLSGVTSGAPPGAPGQFMPMRSGSASLPIPGAAASGPGAPPMGMPPTAFVPPKPPAGPSPGASFLAGPGATPGSGGPAALTGILTQPEIQQSGQTAMRAAQGLPPDVMGRASIGGLAQLIERTSPPGTPDQVKFGALMALQSVLAPTDRQELQFTIANMRNETSREVADIRSRSQQESIDERRRHDMETEDIRRQFGGQPTEYQKFEMGPKFSEDQRHHRADEAMTGAKAQGAVEKGQTAAKQQAEDLSSMAKEADDLAKIVESHPEYVGVSGTLGQKIGSVAEQARLKSMDPEKVNFRARLEQFQARAMKAMTGARYFSGPAQTRMNQLIPGLGMLDAPTSVIQHLRNASQTMAGEAETIERTRTSVGQGVSQGLKDLSTEELERRLQQ